MNKIPLLFGISFCALSIIFGAFGAHILKNKLSDYSISIFNTGVLYQFFHAIGIIIAVIIDFSSNNLVFDSVIWCFIIGIFLFSGSLYIIALTDIKWLGMITPIGGFLFIFGWILMFLKVLKN